MPYNQMREADMLELAALRGSELGYREIMGGELGYREILGQAYPGYSALGDAGMNAMPTERKSIVDVPDGPWKIKIIGQRNAAIAAGAQTPLIEIRPSQDFKIARVMFASEIAPFFGISTLVIGPEQMLLQGEAPATCLSEGALGAALRFRTINVGVPLQIQGINNDAVAHDFKFMLIGIAMS